jgi:hypothetical protein
MFSKQDRKKPLPQTRPDYYEQLRQAQQSLMDHNAKISQLAGASGCN